MKFQENFKMILGGNKSITEDKLKELKNLYKMVNKLKLFNEEELELPLHRYYHLRQKDFLYDIILDEFIILESIFTKGSTSEVGFRLSSNLAYFISKDLTEFKNIHDFVKDYYNVRSKSAHGEDWYKNLSKKKYRKHFGIEDPNTSIDSII